MIDDDGWEPDEDFFVELYDLKNGKRLHGDNTRTKITILDDDKPGVLQLRETSIRAKRSQKTVKVFIDRVDGSDGVA